MFEDTSLYERLCAVSLKLYSSHEEMEGTTSGIVIDSKRGLVLTHASILYPMVDKIIPAKLAKLRETGFIDQYIMNGHVNIEVIVPNGVALKTTGGNKDKQIHLSLLNGSIQEHAAFSKYKGDLKGMFECQNLRQTLQKLTPKDSWQFFEEPLSNSNESKDAKKNPENEELYAQLLPCFILIKLFNASDIKTTACDDSLSIRPGAENKQGDLVEICATPFGLLSPEVFLNSRSQGIVSNAAGPQGVLIMTDARCVPGCEGGALLYRKGKTRYEELQIKGIAFIFHDLIHSLLTGIMIASLCWKNNEWVGLSMACSLSELIGSLNRLTLFNPRHCVSTAIGGSNFRERFIRRMMDHVTCVTVGHSWGTGMHLDGDTVITCSHVLKGHHTTKVMCDQQNGLNKPGCKIVYRIPLQRQFDVAILELPTLYSDTKASTPVQFGRVDEGEVVYVIGHAIFKPEFGLLPTVTRGIVSKVVKYNNIPIMIQTTCAVHAGASGGGVFNTKGEVVALVVCNSRDLLTGACYPHVNMCIPMETISPTINHYLKSKDPSVLKSLHIKNKHIQRLWSIGLEDGTAGVDASHL